MNERDFKNRRILIKKIKDGNVVADTKILRYEPTANSVFISAGSLALKKFYAVSVLIFGKDGLYEFEGTVKGAMVENETEVLLGKRREKEDRKRTRYPIAVDGRIDRVNVMQSDVTLKKPMHAQTVNMSSVGVLLRMDAGSFVIGNRFQTVLDIDDRDIELECEVVRIQNSLPQTEEYGCRIREIRLH